MIRKSFPVRVACQNISLSLCVLHCTRTRTRGIIQTHLFNFSLSLLGIDQCLFLKKRTLQYLSNFQAVKWLLFNQQRRDLKENKHVLYILCFFFYDDPSTYLSHLSTRKRYENCKYITENKMRPPGNQNPYKILTWDCVPKPLKNLDWACVLCRACDISLQSSHLKFPNVFLVLL